MIINYVSAEEAAVECRKLCQDARPARLSVSTPMVAPVILAGPALTMTNFATCIGVVKVSRPPDQR